jgi:hypothetical protein
MAGELEESDALEAEALDGATSDDAGSESLPFEQESATSEQETDSASGNVGFSTESSSQRSEVEGPAVPHSSENELETTEQVPQEQES